MLNLRALTVSTKNMVNTLTQSLNMIFHFYYQPVQKASARSWIAEINSITEKSKFVSDSK